MVKLTNPGISTSIHELVESQFKVFPNPTQGKLSISLNAPMDVEQIKVYDLMGKSVYTKKVSSFYSTSSFRIELAGLSPGMYILSLEGKEIHTQNFILSDKH